MIARLPAYAMFLSRSQRLIASVVIEIQATACILKTLPGLARGFLLPAGCRFAPRYRSCKGSEYFRQLLELMRQKVTFPPRPRGSQAFFPESSLFPGSCRASYLLRFSPK